MNDILSGISFDLYERYALLGRVGPHFASNGRLDVLDIGGHTPSLAENFRSMVSAALPEAFTTVVDLHTEPGLENYVRASSERLPFADASFDLVCSFDMLEHVPREKRAECLHEMLRVTRDGLYVVCPIDSASNQAAERMLRNHLESQLGAPVGALVEHERHGLPSYEGIRDVLAAEGYPLLSFGHGNTDVWLLMMLTYHTLRVSDGDPLVIELNRRFNTGFAAADWAPPHYRACFLLSKKQPQTQLEHLLAALRGCADSEQGFERVLRLCQTMLLLAHEGRLVRDKDRHIANLEQILVEERRGSARALETVQAEVSALREEFFGIRSALANVVEAHEAAFGDLAKELADVRIRLSALLESPGWNAFSAAGALASKLRPAHDAPRSEPEEIELTCDQPAPEELISEMLVVRGWALAPSGMHKVTVKMDGGPPAAARTGLFRPDVARERPGRYGASRAGFELALGSLPAGAHVLTIRAESRRGAAVELQRNFQIGVQDNR